MPLDRTVPDKNGRTNKLPHPRTEGGFKPQALRPVVTVRLGVRLRRRIDPGSHRNVRCSATWWLTATGMGPSPRLSTSNAETLNVRTADGVYRGISVQAMPARAADEKPFYIAMIADHIKTRR